MLQCRDFALFWEWYLPEKRTLTEEVAEKLKLLRADIPVRSAVFLDWGKSLGYNIDYSAVEGFIIVGEHKTMDDSDAGWLEAVEIFSHLLEGKPFVKKEKVEFMEDLVIELYSVDSKGKTRISINKLVEIENGFEIQRTTGLADGKKTPQPVKTITAGKVKRTVKEQAQLEFDAIIKKQKDKGYKSKEDLEVTDSADISEALGTKRTTVDGFNKPMGAKDFSTVTKKDPLYSKDWYASLKIDGIRTLGHLDTGIDQAKPKVIFKSRGGLVFKGIATRFEYNAKLIQICKQFNCEIDGEFYIHGVPLEIISGACRLDDYVPERHDEMKFYIFDIADDHRTFEQRKLVLDQIREILEDDDEFVVVDHVLITGKDKFDDFHTKAVEDGFEGLIIRDGNKLYQFGKKNAAMFKIKLFQDDEFEVIGWKPGLRPTEDMTFILKLPNGDTFEAKPMGNLAQKEEYVNNMESLIGQFGTVKFFYYTSKGIPFLPSFKAFRPMDKKKVLI